MTGEISDSTETDWFKVSLTPGQLYRFELQDVVAGYDWQLALRLPDGSDLIRGVVSFHYASDAEVFAYRPFRSGEHLLEVKTYNNPADTTYTLEFWEIEVDEVGDCAGDPATVCSISVGSSKTGYLARYLFGDKDFDWWSVTLEEGETYVIDMKGSGDSTPARDNPQTIADPLVALHDSAGFQVTENNNILEFNDGAANYNSRITYTVPDGEGGTYYVSAVSGETHLGTYEITVQLSE